MMEVCGAGYLHTPERPDGNGLVLTHGAGANCQTPLLIAVANVFEQVGMHVLRIDLPFRQRRASGPPLPSQAAEDRARLRAALDTLRARIPGKLFLGGHSYGGRQASMLAAEDEKVAAGLLLLSYPLHPPGKPAQLRTAHFEHLHTRAVFVHGSKDDFGSEEELRAALRLIPAPTALSMISGAGHDLKRGKLDLPVAVMKPWLELMVER